MFAVIAIGSKQYKVAKDDVITVDRLAGKVGEVITFDRVLLTGNDGKVKVGNPIVKGMQVTAKIIAHEKGVKIDVMRFKSKVRERRHIGFRAELTKLSILTIGNA